MQNIKICDITLSGKNENKKFSFKDKLNLAKKLDVLNVSTIEVGPVLDDQEEAILIRTIAKTTKNALLSCEAACDTASISKAFEVIGNANKKQISIQIPASSMQMEYITHKKSNKVLESILECVKFAKTLVDNVEVDFIDSTRSDDEFLEEAIKLSIESGATKVCLEDTAGVCMPEAFANKINDLKTKIPTLNDVSMSVLVNDSYSMGVACSLSAIASGVEEIKASVFNHNSPALDKLAQAINTLGKKINAKTDIDFTNLGKIINELANSEDTIKKVKNIANKDLIPNTSNIEDLTSIISSLGYELSSTDACSVYETFKMVSSKKDVTLNELEVMIASSVLQVPATYQIDSFVINSGNRIFSTASVSLIKNGTVLYGLSKGDGPIDAAFLAIESIMGHHYELEDFQIEAASQGREAMGEALVKLRYNGKLYSGIGVSTDIIGSSIRAFISAINKIAYEEENI